MGELPEKLAKMGGTPILGTFWRFWGFPVKTVCNPGLPGNPSQQRKRYTDLRGSVLPRVDFAIPVCLGPKSSLGRTSERTPEGRCAVLSADLDSLGGQDCTPFSPQISKISKKCPKQGYPPPFWPIFQEVPPYIGPPIASRWLEVRFPPPPSGPS